MACAVIISVVLIPSCAGSILPGFLMIVLLFMFIFVGIYVYVLQVATPHLEWNFILIYLSLRRRKSDGSPQEIPDVPIGSEQASMYN